MNRLASARFFCNMTLDSNNFLLGILYKRFGSINGTEIKVEDKKACKVVIVRTQEFNHMPIEKQHKLVISLLPENIRDSIEVQTFGASKEIDRTIAPVVLRKVEAQYHVKICETPQSFLDHAVYQLDHRRSGAMALESMWQCGSLALENFSFANGFDPKLNISKNYLVSFLHQEYPNVGFHMLWGNLWRCHTQSFDDEEPLIFVRESLKPTQTFCNALHNFAHMNRLASARFFCNMTLDSNNFLLGILYKRFGSINGTEIKVEDKKACKVVIVRTQEFNHMPIEKQHKLVISLLPENIRDSIEVQTFGASKEIDRTIAPVVLRKVEAQYHVKICETPQSFLDHAVYQLDHRRSGAMALESMWQCGSLALENFSFANGFDPKSNISKNYLVSFLHQEYPNVGFHMLWGNLWRCHTQSFDDEEPLIFVRESLKPTQTFCNALYDIYLEKSFDTVKFRAQLPDWMLTEKYFKFF